MKLCGVFFFLPWTSAARATLRKNLACKNPWNRPCLILFHSTKRVSSFPRRRLAWLWEASSAWFPGALAKAAISRHSSTSWSLGWTHSRPTGISPKPKNSFGRTCVKHTCNTDCPPIACFCAPFGPSPFITTLLVQLVELATTTWIHYRFLFRLIAWLLLGSGWWHTIQALEPYSQAQKALLQMTQRAEGGLWPIVLLCPKASFTLV